jgi:hypothetical protein
MNNLEKEFVEYTEALELKKLGFDEPCFGWFNTNNNDSLALCDLFGFLNELTIRDFHKNSIDDKVSAPTYSQAFRWFRKKGYRFSVIIDSPLAEEESHYIEIWFEKQFLHESHYIYKTYEDAELDLLKKLIEYVKEKQQ